MPLPTRQEIIKMKQTLRDNLDNFKGNIYIDVRPYLTFDISYKLDFALRNIYILVYSANYPFTFWRWIKELIAEVNAHIRRMRQQCMDYLNPYFIQTIVCNYKKGEKHATINA